MARKPRVIKSSVFPADDMETGRQSRFDTQQGETWTDLDPLGHVALTPIHGVGVCVVRNVSKFRLAVFEIVKRLCSE